MMDSAWSPSEAATGNSSSSSSSNKVILTGTSKVDVVFLKPDTDLVLRDVRPSFEVFSHQLSVRPVLSYSVLCLFSNSFSY